MTDLLKRVICKLFGHRQYSGWWGDALYGEVHGGYTDGIGRSHFTVEKPCGRCGKNYVLARFHGDTGDLKARHTQAGDGE